MATVNGFIALANLSQRPISSPSPNGQRECKDGSNPLQRKRMPDTTDNDILSQKKARTDCIEESLYNPEDTASSSVLPQHLSLCSRCSETDFDAALHDDTSYGTRIPVLRNESANCKLCRFFDDIKWVPVKQMTDGPTLSYDLVAGHAVQNMGRFAILPSYFPNHVLSSESQLEKFGTKRRVFFAHGSDRGKVRGKVRGYARILQPQALDYDRARSWLSFCDCHHKELCKSSTSMHGLTVIDCRSRQLAAMDNLSDPYVTLSYVWGHSPSALKFEPGRLPEAFERTIEDSMAVVTALGFRYLWVDRYCIPQDNAAERHSQIQRMGDIYASSALTIIAAAGDNPDFGLPGVSLRARKECRSVQVGSLVLVTVPPRIGDEVRASKWSTRGWTYQEGLLARRRLIFTESQTYFQCAAMHCEESISIPPASLHIKSLERFRDNLHGLFPRYGIGKRTEEIIDLISGYVNRQFSHPSDALDAFQGILRAYQSFKIPLHHLCGVIVFPPKLFKTTENWTISEMFALGLSWCEVFPLSCIRRPDFPSWSWLGWQFNGHYILRLNPPVNRRSYEVLFIAGVELDSKVVPLEHTTWFNPQNSLDKPYPCIIIAQAWTFDLDITGDFWTPTMLLPNLLRKGYGTRSMRMKDLYSFIAHAFDEAGIRERDDDEQSAQITAMILGKEDDLRMGRGKYDVLFLRYSRTNQAYVRLPFIATFFSCLNFDGNNNGHMESLKLKRRQTRLA